MNAGATLYVYVQVKVVHVANHLRALGGRHLPLAFKALTLRDFFVGCHCYSKVITKALCEECMSCSNHYLSICPPKVSVGYIFTLPRFPNLQAVF